MSDRNPIFTVGHSNLAIDEFASILARAGIDAIADVRSSPFSRFNPQYNKAVLASALKQRGIHYVFLGAELGARPADPSLYVGGIAKYELISASEPFKLGISRLRAGAERFKIALMCAEKDPLDCHRAILVGRRLKDGLDDLVHVHSDGTVESNEEMEARLLRACGLPDTDMFRSRQELLDLAYEQRGRQIEFVEAEARQVVLK